MLRDIFALKKKNILTIVPSLKISQILDTISVMFKRKLAAYNKSYAPHSSSTWLCEEEVIPKFLEHNLVQHKGG